MKQNSITNKDTKPPAAADYRALASGISGLLEAARRASARTVNTIMTATYWETGRRIVEYDQSGERRAGYGDALLARLARDLTVRLGRGFSRQNLQRFRTFYLFRPAEEVRNYLRASAAELPICSTLSSKSWPTPKGATGTVTSPFNLAELAQAFPLPWSHYVLLISRSRSPEAFAFYHAEALRGGWSVRQLRRQIDSQFYERAALSRNKASFLARAGRRSPPEAIIPSEEIRDPLILEFLNLKDEYSESDLEESLIRHLESFLLELGEDFAFVGRQRRLRVGNEWYRVDLLLFHRVLRCLVVIDLKLGELTHADAGQMNLYINYAREHWMRPGENPPVGLILCASADAALARYALGSLTGKVLTREYRLALPKEKLLADELVRTREHLMRRVQDGVVLSDGGLRSGIRKSRALGR